MSKKPDFIDLSSDSESDQSGWINYFPLNASSFKELIFYEDAQALNPLAIGFLDKEESPDLASQLPNALSTALGSALSSMNKVPMREKTAKRPKPAKQIMGLPCPKWLAMQNQAKGSHKAKSSYKGKVKKPME